jgi:hypothetical protein
LTTADELDHATRVIPECIAKLQRSGMPR